MTAIASWIREPLLQFCVLGMAIFVLFVALNPQGAGDKVIVVEPATAAELADGFIRTTGRSPTAEELDNLIEGWVQTEVLYREGLALGLDKGDAAIRERVVLNMKANARMQAVVDLPPEAELRAWFEARRADYDQPRRFDISVIRLRDRRDDAAAEAERLRDAIAGGTDPLLLGHHPTPYPRQSAGEIRETFGAEVLAALETLPVGEWTVVRAPGSWYIVGLTAVEAAQPADFATLRTAIEDDWRREQQLRLAAAMTNGMRANYEVKRADRR